MPDPRFPGKPSGNPQRPGGPPGPPRPPGPPPRPPQAPGAPPAQAPAGPEGSPEPKECPKCKGKMVTHSQANNCCAITLLGKDEQGQFVFNPAAGVPVALFCCEGCGFIEFYSAVTLGLV